MACFLSSFRYSETEFSSLLKYVRYRMASSYSGYTTVTFLKAKKRQNNSPCSAQPPAESSSKSAFGFLTSILCSKSWSSCLLPLIAALPPFSLSKATVLLTPMALGAEVFAGDLWPWAEALQQSLFLKVPVSGMLRGWDVKSQNCLGHFLLLPVPI